MMNWTQTEAKQLYWAVCVCVCVCVMNCRLLLMSDSWLFWATAEGVYKQTNKQTHSNEQTLTVLHPAFLHRVPGMTVWLSVGGKRQKETGEIKKSVLCLTSSQFCLHVEVYFLKKKPSEKLSVWQRYFNWKQTEIFFVQWQIFFTCFW